MLNPLNNWTLKKEKYHKKTMVLLFFILNSILVIAQNNRDSIEIEPIRSIQVNKNSEQSHALRTKIADSLLKASTFYIQKGDFLLALQNALEGLRLYKAVNNITSIGHSLGKIGTIHYYQGNFAEALSFYNQSIPFFEKTDYKKGITSSTNNIGAIYYYLGNYPKALDFYKKALKLNESLNDNKQTAATLQNIGGIYVELNDYTNAMKYFQIAKEVYEETSDERALSQVLNGIGEIQLKQGEYANALTNLEASLQLAVKTNDTQKTIEVVFNLGKLYGLQKNFDRSLVYYNRSLQMAKEVNSSLYHSLSLIAIGSIQYQLGKNQKAITNCKKGLKLAKELKTVSVQKDACKCLYQVYKTINNKGSALNYYEQTQTLKDSLQAKQTADKILNMEFEKEMLVDSLANAEKRHKLQIAHRLALHKKERQRNLFLVSGCFVLVLAGGLWSRLNYTKKSKARLQIEKDRSEHLLLNILPEEIAEELKEKGYVDAQYFETASILFTDFKSFTETASKLTPQELVEEINVCFKAFDAIMGTYNIEKIKTIGDAYMAAGGLPKPDTQAVKKTILAGLDMQEFIIKRKLENANQDKPAFDMRVGIHVGPIVAGIVGVKKFQYDIWGDTVNTASRMESNGDVGKVNISQDTYNLVKDQKDLAFDYRGKIAAKGKGNLEMYFARRIANNSKKPC